MNGATLLLALIGLTVLYLAYRVAVWIAEAPLMPPEYSTLDRLDGLPHDAVSHETRMNERAARVGMPR